MKICFAADEEEDDQQAENFEAEIVFDEAEVDPREEEGQDDVSDFERGLGRFQRGDGEREGVYRRAEADDLRLVVNGVGLGEEAGVEEEEEGDEEVGNW